MALTPIDVQQKTFKIALRGYAEDEVDTFLDEVVISLREHEQRLNDANERISLLEDQLKANRETDDAMRRTFVAAQRTADAIVNEAREEADRMLADATSKANLLTEQQAGERERLVDELAEMRAKTARFRVTLAEMAGSIQPGLEALDAELTATEYEPLDPPEAPPAAEDIAEQDAMFERPEDTAEMTTEDASPDDQADELDELSRSERLARQLGQDTEPPQKARTWDPVISDEEREQFEWDRSAEGARRPWERG